MYRYSVRVWDVIILCPNAVFLLYLAVKMRTAVMKLRRSSSPVLTTFFLLVSVHPVHSSVLCVRESICVTHELFSLSISLSVLERC